MKTIQTNQINTHKGDGLSAKTLASYNFGEWPEQIYECVKEQSQNIDPNS